MKLISRLLFFLAFVIVLAIVIAYARGYRLDLQKKSVTPTGILAINSYPKAASIYLDGTLKGVTDQNLSLPPGKYKIEIKKDGYATWSRKITLKGELVESVDVLLFPINPSLSPLTNLGITTAIPIDQSEKVLLFSENSSIEKDGIYLFDPNKSPLSFFPPLKFLVLKSNLPANIAFSAVAVTFSPDLKEGIFDFETISYLFSLEEENKNISEITPESRTNLLVAWEKEKQDDINKILETYPKEVKKIATDSFKIISFSPDKTKILYQAKINIDLPLVIKPPLIASNQTPEERSVQTDNFYVYDKKEDKNFKISNIPALPAGRQYPISNSLIWYSDSEHLVVNETKKISIMGYDGENKQVIYSGPYEQNFLAVTTDGKLLILTNLNSQINKLPDIYAVGIK